MAGGHGRAVLIALGDHVVGTHRLGACERGHREGCHQAGSDHGAWHLDPLVRLHVGLLGDGVALTREGVKSGRTSLPPAAPAPADAGANTRTGAWMFFRRSAPTSRSSAWVKSPAARVAASVTSD